MVRGGSNKKMRKSLGEKVWAGYEKKKIDEKVPRRDGMGGSKKK